MLDELKVKRERENAEAERHRRRRDELNDRTREWVAKRDELNGQVRLAKEERDKWNRARNEILDRLGELRRRKLPRGAVPLGKLKRELKALEFRQMTSVLTVDKERALIDEMARLQAEVRRLEKALEENEEVRKVAQELKEAEDKAEAAHRNVSKLAEEAQAEHDLMTQLYERSDETRRQADLAQEEFIKTKMAADEEHRKHIEHIRQVHDYDKIVHGIWIKERKVTGEEEDVSAKRQAEMIFERFKKGEKLSTDDLMTLQKSGYL